MTTQEWDSLRVGDIITNNKGGNPRPVIYKNNKSRSIKLPSSRTWGGLNYTVYCSGDKYLFKKTYFRIKTYKEINTYLRIKTQKKWNTN